MKEISGMAKFKIFVVVLPERRRKAGDRGCFLDGNRDLA